MCAIVAGQKKNIPLDYIWEALKHRGTNGYGFMAFTDGEPEIYKSLKIKEVLKEFKELPDDTFVIAHNRNTSIGSNTIELTHPVTVGDMSIVHNGTSNDLYFLHKSASSDTEAIADGLNNSLNFQKYFDTFGNLGIGIVIGYDKDTKLTFLSADGERHLFTNGEILVSEPFDLGEWRLLVPDFYYFQPKQGFLKEFEFYKPIQVTEINVKKCKICKKEHIHTEVNRCTVCQSKGLTEVPEQANKFTDDVDGWNYMEYLNLAEFGEIPFKP